MNLAVLSCVCEESEIPLPLTTAHIRNRASLTVGITAVAVGVLSVACSSNGTPAPTTTTTTTTTRSTSAAASGGGHHEKHESSGGSGGGAVQAPAETDTVTVAPSTVTNTETDVQTTVQTSVQTSVATETQTVTATPTWQQRSRDQFGPQQGH